MDLPDAGATQRGAHLRTGALVAGVLDSRAVLDVGPSVAVLAAPPQLRVERVEDVAVERAHLDGADEGTDVPLRVAHVGVAGGRLPGG